jgi:glycerol-3-phosphate dehydrogenase
MNTEYDVAVIGGGIIGAACAFECAHKGLRTILLEKSDFGSETSAGSFKIIHGGLRYLQHLDFSRVKESVREQYLLRKNVPHLVTPLPFLVPCYGFGKRGKAAMHIACSMYEFLSKGRNKNMPDSLVLPDHAVLSKEEVLSIAPELSFENLKGGVVFHDCQMRNPDRLTLAVVKSAEKAGAVVRNYTEVVKIISTETPEGRKIESLRVKKKGGMSEEIRVGHVINAMGPWAERVGDLFDESKKERISRKVRYSKGIQLIVPEIISTYALSVESKGSDHGASLRRGGRSFFLQPWRGRTLIGTTDTIYEDDPSTFSITNQEIQEFLLEVREAYPSKKLDPSFVSGAFGGLRAISNAADKAAASGIDRSGMVNTTRDEVIVDHATDSGWKGLPKVTNMVSVVGVKYTTFRNVAEEVVAVLEKKGIKGAKNTTSDIQLFGAPSLDAMEHFLENSIEKLVKAGAECTSTSTISNDLIYEYGTEIDELLNYTEQSISDKKKSFSEAFMSSRIRYAIEREYVQNLKDLVLRRFSEYSLGDCTDEFISLISREYAAESGLDSDSIDKQRKELYFEMGTFRKMAHEH